jgi:hypothetical protein
MFDDIIEGECNGRNYYDSEPWEHEDDSNCTGPSSTSNKSREFKWFSGGKEYKLSELSDKHLDNAINYCNKLRKTKELWYLTNEKEKRTKIQKRDEWDSMSCNCQFCGHKMKVGYYHITDGDCTSSEERLICKCGAMGPVIELHEYQCL